MPLLSTESLTPVITSLGKSLGLSYSSKWFKPRQTWSDVSTNEVAAYFEMLSQPWIAAAAETRILLVLSYIQEYTHDDEKIQDEVRSQIAKIPGSFKTILSQLLSSSYCGFSIAEKWYSVASKRAAIAGVNWLDPRRIEFDLDESGEIVVLFRLGKAKQENIILKPENYLHFRNQPYFNAGNSPKGYAPLKRALPFWEQYRLVMLAMAIAAQRQATPLLVGKTSGDDQYTAIEMLNKLEQARNSGVLVIDLLDQVDAIAQQTDGAFFVSMLRIIRQGILMSFLIPETILGQGESGSGDSNLNKGHLSIIRTVARSQADSFAEELIEQLFKPMLEFNYGSIQDWGKFPISKDEPENAIGLINALADAVTKGVADTDKVVARVAELANL